jgi:hypothetical protein
LQPERRGSPWVQEKVYHGEKVCDKRQQQQQENNNNNNNNNIIIIIIIMGTNNNKVVAQCYVAVRTQQS